MPHFHLSSSVPCSPLNHFPKTLLYPLVSIVVDYTHFQPKGAQSYCHTSLFKSMSLSFVKAHSFEALSIDADAGEMSDVGKCCGSKFSTDSSVGKPVNEEIQLGYNSYSSANHREIQRRKRIGLANKGKVPWNKGKSHSAETRERIKQMTIEALKDPKVRKKMSEFPRTHSDQSKERIKISLRRVWEERLKWKRLREKFILSWVQSIARAAKEGGSSQQELEWDSYDKLKKEMVLQQLQRAAEKAKAKEMAKLRAERAALAKAEKMAKLAQKRKEQKQKAKEREEIKKSALREIKKLAAAQERKRKERLTKIHKRRPINGHVHNQGEIMTLPHPASEKLDLEFVKREKLRREVSLADQIRAAKNRRAELAAKDAWMINSGSAT